MVYSEWVLAYLSVFINQTLNERLLIMMRLIEIL